MKINFLHQNKQRAFETAGGYITPCSCGFGWRCIFLPDILYIMIYLGADHRGYNLKEDVKKFLAENGQSFEDMGNLKYNPNDDYTDYAKLVAEKVSQNPEMDKGILICGSGVGVDITANKFKGVRSALADDVQTAKQSREHDDTNVLSLPDRKSVV